MSLAEFEEARLRFEAAAEDPTTAQENLLFGLLSKNQDTVFGRDHGFASIETVEDFRKRVPITTFDRLAPYVERMLKGEPDVLFAGKAVAFALTSGSTGTPKHIPIPADYRDALVEYLGPMWAAQELVRPGHLDCGLAITGDSGLGVSEGGVPLSMFSGLVRKAFPDVAMMTGVPSGVFETHHDLRSYLLLSFALRQDLRTVSCLSPSNLLALFRDVETFSEALIADLHDGGLAHAPSTSADLSELAALLPASTDVAKRLKELLEAEGHFNPTKFWPKLDMVSVWRAANMKLHLPQLKELFPRATFWATTTGASEASILVSIKSDWDGGVPAITATYFEWLPAGAEPIDANLVPLEKLCVGREYQLVVTNSRGMYRYAMDDLFTVHGWYKKLPIAEFVGRTGQVSDMVGEHMSERDVVMALEACEMQDHFAGCEFAPLWGEPPTYVLFVELQKPLSSAQLSSMLANFEEQLQKMNVNYYAERGKKLLRHAQIAVLPEGTFAKRRQEKIAASGHSDAQLKIPILNSSLLHELPGDVVLHIVA